MAWARGVRWRGVEPIVWQPRRFNEAADALAEAGSRPLRLSISGAWRALLAQTAAAGLQTVARVWSDGGLREGRPATFGAFSAVWVFDRWLVVEAVAGPLPLGTTVPTAEHVGVAWGAVLLQRLGLACWGCGLAPLQPLDDAQTEGEVSITLRARLHFLMESCWLAPTVLGPRPALGMGGL